MIPLHIADQAVAACEAEIQKLRAELQQHIRAKADSDVMHDAKNATIQGLVEERDGLLAENTYFKSEVERLYNNIISGISVNAECRRLKADVERLVKAGDDVFCIACNAPSSEGRQKILQAWQAAKKDAR